MLPSRAREFYTEYKMLNSIPHQESLSESVEYKMLKDVLCRKRLSETIEYAKIINAMHDLDTMYNCRCNPKLKSDDVENINENKLIFIPHCNLHHGCRISSILEYNDYKPCKSCGLSDGYYATKPHPSEYYKK